MTFVWMSNVSTSPSSVCSKGMRTTSCQLNAYPSCYFIFAYVFLETVLL